MCYFVEYHFPYEAFPVTIIIRYKSLDMAHTCMSEQCILSYRLSAKEVFSSWELHMNNLSLANLLNMNGGWLNIGPPYIYINIDPVLVHLGPLAVRWYGLMYVIGILIG